MNKIIVEVGSTCIKVDKFDGNNIENLTGKTIQLKKHYNEDGCLRESDIKELTQSINELKSISSDIYVCGTSIFRTLKEEEKLAFLNRFEHETGLSFNIISQDKENELTVYGAKRFVKDKVCVFIGGGGSTELAIYDNGIKESVNSNIILILSGGGHAKFARLSGIKYEENTLYKDSSSPIMMDIETRKSETERYYKAISLDEIRNRVNDPDWWYATRAMCAFVLVVAEEIGAKYIVPTDIAMVYGILGKGV